MYKKARQHFKKVDPLLYQASMGHTIEDTVTSTNLYRDIIWTIIGQQLSGKVADTIFERFELLFPKKKITPKNTAELTEKEMRTAGLSGAKIRAIQDLTKKVIAGELNLKRLPELSDDEVMAELTKVKGVGPWTAEMVMMFSLGRTDVFSLGDLVLRKSIIELYKFKKQPSEKKLQNILRAWSPYRTYAAHILWKIADQKSNNFRKKLKGT